jgi:hypothetical protein
MAKVRRVFISSLEDVRVIFSSVSVILNLKVLLSIQSLSCAAEQSTRPAYGADGR